MRCTDLSHRQVLENERQDHALREMPERNFQERMDRTFQGLPGWAVDSFD